MDAIADICAKAESALQRRWPAARAGVPVELSNSGRSTVLRLPLTGVPAESVIVKGYSADDRSEALKNEAVAATLFDASIGQTLLASDLAERVLVLSDLGTHPALSDVLLGDDPGAATAGLVAWAKALAGIAARTRDSADLVEQVERRLGITRAARSIERFLSDSTVDFAARVSDRFGLSIPAGLHADISAALGIFAASPYTIFGPADTCPDNNQLTPDGIRFLDYEFADAYPLFLDAAFVLLPFPTCWCTLDVPQTVAETMRTVYRNEIVNSFPELADDELWDDGVIRACALCVMMLLNPILDSAPGEDGPGYDVHGVQFPARAARVHFRLARLLRLPGSGSPALRDVLRAIDERLIAEYDSLDMPVYPAFC